MPIPRRRLAVHPPDHPSYFQPGNQLARNRGRPRGARNRNTNLLVAGIHAAIKYYGQEYLVAHGYDGDVNLLSDEQLFGGFMCFLAEKDLKAFASIVRGLVPRGVTINIESHASVEVLAPAELRSELEQRGLRLPPTYALSAAHGNDDDTVTEAEIVQVLDRPS